MLRAILALVAVFALFVSGALAGEGTIVNFGGGKVTVKVGDKELSADSKDVKFLDGDGKEVQGRKRRETFKKDTKVEVTEKDGKITEIKVKK